MYETQVLDAYRRLQNHEGDAFCLISHASYLFKTGGALWAVDPAHQVYRVPTLEGLSFVLVTHEHPDHYQSEVLARLAASGTRILAPGFLPGIEAVPGVTTVVPGDDISLFGHRVRVLPGQHYDEGTDIGVEEVSYWVDAPGLSVALPGDVRDYSRPFPLRGPDWLMAHVWLGRGNALNLPCEPWRSDAARYFRDIAARHTLLAHLNDETRALIDRWTEEHACLLAPYIPNSLVLPAFTVYSL